jgi:hypothetical protein
MMTLRHNPQHDRFAQPAISRAFCSLKGGTQIGEELERSYRLKPVDSTARLKVAAP